MGTSGTVLSNSHSRRMLEGMSGGNHYYSIDARGTDPVLTEQRTQFGCCNFGGCDIGELEAKSEEVITL